MRVVCLALLACLCGLFYVLANIPVFNSSYDQLHQLAGAVRLYSGRSYAGTGDLSAQSWPPLYAFYIAAVLNLQTTFSAIAIANGVLVALCAASWVFFLCFIRKTFGPGPDDPAGARAPRYALWAAGVLSSLFILDILTFPASPSLYALLLPWFLKLIIQVYLEPYRPLRLLPLVSVTVLFANSHNLAVIALLAFCPLFILALFLRQEFSKAGQVAISALLSAAVWLGVRDVFGLNGAHEFVGLFQADRSAISALWNLTIGLADTVFAPAHLGIFILLVAGAGIVCSVGQRSGSRQPALWLLGIGTFLNYVILYAVFMSVPIDSSIHGRFLLLALLLVLSALVTMAASRTRWMTVVIVGALMLPMVSESARVLRWFTRIHIEHVYQRHDYVVASSRSVDLKTLDAMSARRCRASECHY